MGSSQEGLTQMSEYVDMEYRIGAQMNQLYLVIFEEFP